MRGVRDAREDDHAAPASVGMNAETRTYGSRRRPAAGQPLNMFVNGLVNLFTRTRPTNA
jgi:hypothetical protein